MYRCMHKYLNIKCLFSGPQTQQKVQPHDSCIKKIAALRIENEQLYAELARLQTENAELSSKIRDFDIEEQLISNDSKTKFYTGIPTKAVFMWLLAFCTSGPGATKLKYSENKYILRMKIFTQLRINLLFSTTKLFSQI